MSDCHYNDGVTATDSIVNDVGQELAPVVFRLMVTGSCQTYRGQLAVLVVSAVEAAAQYTSDELLMKPMVERRLLVRPAVLCLESPDWLKILDHIDFAVPFQNPHPCQMQSVWECLWMLLQPQPPKH